MLGTTSGARERYFFCVLGSEHRCFLQYLTSYFLNDLRTSYKYCNVYLVLVELLRGGTHISPPPVSGKYCVVVNI